jgi:hypothetical protein
VITGEALAPLTGLILEDRPILAKEKVRYYEETVAVVVANSDTRSGACM